ncbi:MAG: C13 family peptidase [Burkholderiales bacterium]|nr:C13 family peptidase [Burkholderiales bacterium]
MQDDTAAADMAAENPLPAVPRGTFYHDVLSNLRAGARLAFLRPVSAEMFTPAAGSFALIAGLHLLLLLLLGLASVGFRGEFNDYEVPRALLFVPATLLFALLAVRLNGRASLLQMAIALVAASLVLSLLFGAAGVLLLRLPPRLVGGNWWPYLFYGAVLWWTLVIAMTVARLVNAGAGRNLAVMAAGWLLLAAPMLWYPQNYLWMPKYDASGAAEKSARAPFDERGFYAQQETLRQSLAAVEGGRPGVADIYLLAAGLYAREDVFMKEVRLIADLFHKRFDTAGRSVVLLNNRKTLDTHPVASLTSIGAALQRIGSQMNRDEDLLVMYLSSHGSESHRLAVDFWPLRLAPIDPPALKKALDDSGIKWRVIVVSACYSGGFIKPLQDEHTMIITASSAKRQSFGCGSTSDATYLAQALFNEELRKTWSFETAFAAARQSIAERERAQGYEPSEPQLFAGAEIRRKLAEIEARLAQQHQN